MSFDNLCKLLSEKYPDCFLNWLLGETPASVTVLKTELSIEPIRADSVTLLQTDQRIVHLEFQTRIESNPPLPLRMLDYWVRLHRLYRLPVTQIVVLLLPPSDPSDIETTFSVESTRHEYQVLRLWEQDPEVFLNDPALLPFASLAAASDPVLLLQQVAQQVSRIESTQQRQEVCGYAELLAGLKFNKQLIRQVFAEGFMRESVIYQEIFQEGVQEGVQKGRQEGRQEGELALVLLLLEQRVGQLPDELRDRLSTLDLPQLEILAVALLNFSQVSDLVNWLEQ
jgi:predicted transposase/invertase (TIGR01784 family)